MFESLFSRVDFEQMTRGLWTRVFPYLNSLHPSLRFTFEKEYNQPLPFLDVFVGKNEHEFVTSIYRKPTFIGQIIRWNSFCPMKRKTNLISTLVHRALVVCSKSTLQIRLWSKNYTLVSAPPLVASFTNHDVAFSLFFFFVNCVSI